MRLSKHNQAGDFCRQTDVGGSPGLEATAHQAKFPREGVGGKVEIDSLAERINGGSGSAGKRSFLTGGNGPEIPAAEKSIQIEHIFGILQQLASPAAAEDAHEQDLQAAIPGLTKSQAQLGIIQTGGGNVGDACGIPLQTNWPGFAADLG